MKNKLEKIYESKIVHNSFLDKDSVIDAMTESYILGLTLFYAPMHQCQK